MISEMLMSSRKFKEKTSSKQNKNKATRNMGPLYLCPTDLAKRIGNKAQVHKKKELLATYIKLRPSTCE